MANLTGNVTEGLLNVTGAVNDTGAFNLTRPPPVYRVPHHNGALGSRQHPPANPRAALVIYLVMLTLMGAQVCVVLWKHHHQRSYDMVSLVGLWLIPGFAAIHFHWWSFLGVWAIFSAITIYMFVLCLRSVRLDPSTPRLVFSWFLGSHNVCVAVGAAGYVLFLVELLGLQPVVAAIFGKTMSATLLWYGLYFGILGRDTAEVAFSGLAQSMAYGRKLSVDPNVCALCTKAIEDMSHVGGEAPPEATIQLPCKHVFHALCIRGWTMVGKKDTCPTCLEKCDLKHLYADRPWEARNLQYNGMLDFVRYMVVWFPVIMTMMYLILHVLHLDANGQEVPSGPPHAHNATGALRSPPLVQAQGQQAQAQARAM